MKKKLKLKPFVLPIFYIVFLIAVITSLYFSIDTEPEEKYIYVSKTILDEYIPVIKTNQQILKPYTDMNVYKSNDYYDYQGTDDNQLQSIIEYDNIYIQNTGINYASEQQFEIISILDGQVIDVSEKELLGKSVTIRHNNELISVYQCLDNFNVQKDDKVVSGEVIATSGSCELIPSSKNNLHFELYVNGIIENPETYYGKEVK